VAEPEAAAAAPTVEAVRDGEATTTISTESSSGSEEASARRELMTMRSQLRELSAGVKELLASRTVPAYQHGGAEVAAPLGGSVQVPVKVVTVPVNGGPGPSRGANPGPIVTNSAPLERPAEETCSQPGASHGAIPAGRMSSPPALHPRREAPTTGRQRPADVCIAGLSPHQTDADDGAHRFTQEWVNDHAADPAYTPSYDRMAAAFASALRASETRSVREDDPRMTTFMARQTGAKDLPPFSGDPLEWRIFKAQFTQSTRMCALTHAENILRLQRALAGRARATVSALLVDPVNVPEIIQMLEASFGNNEIVIERVLSRVRGLPKLNNDAPTEAIIDYAVAVRNVIATVEGLDGDHLSSPRLLAELVGKLPMCLRWMWFASRAGTVVKARPSDLAEWLKILTGAIPYAGGLSCEAVRREARRTASGQVFATQVRKPSGAPQEKTKRCGACGQSSCQSLNSCTSFIGMSYENKWALVRRLAICFLCLGANHRSVTCKAKRCPINQCGRVHHKILHQHREPPAAGGTSQVLHTTASESEIALKVLPVTLVGPRGRQDIYALLDEGSTITLLEEKVANAIGLVGESANLKLRGVGGIAVSDARSRRMNVQIGNGVGKPHVAVAYTVRELKLPAHVMRDSGGRPYGNPVVPRMLIGLDNAELIVPRGESTFLPSGVVISYTPLGRVAFGGDQTGYRGTVLTLSQDVDLDSQVRFHFSIESLGITSAPRVTADERRARDIMEVTTHALPSGGWETGLLWKEDGSTLPNNKQAAQRRLDSLEQKFRKDPVLAEAYRTKIREYEEKGYAVVLTPSEEAAEHNRKWYLPHFAVQNPNKPNKIRVVFDAASKCRGVSLNDHLLSGPDLLTSLVGHIQRFREGKVAIAADIQEMFLRIKMRAEDQYSQLFLWKQEPGGIPVTMMMKSMMFGARCSPCSAQYVRDCVARESEEAFPRAAEAVRRNMYMDDYLDATDDVAGAKGLVSDVTKLLERGGFHITSWASNVSAALHEVEGGDKGASLVAIGETPSTERVLGIHWEPSTDNFIFRYTGEGLEGPDWPTKRQALSETMRVFDPMGFIGSLTVRAKIILQEIWRSGIGWDEPLHEEHARRWREWKAQLANLDVRIPRCCVYLKTEQVTLHLFGDASERACCTVAYFTHPHGRSFIASRCRVAPLKPLSIPRLELQAALMAARLAASIKKETNMSISRTVFWTDSTTVLCWLRTDPLKYSAFVANRLGEIDETTGGDEWRWVPTKLNPADIGTRDQLPLDWTEDGTWFKGPAFLSQPESEWPQERQRFSPSEEKLETRRGRPVMGHCFRTDGLPEASRFSSWTRLLRSTAWVMRFIAQCRRHRLETCSPARPGGNTELRAEEVQRAEEHWVRLSQSRSFSNEVEILRRGEALPAGNRLLAATPFLDKNGVLRMDTRLHAVPNELRAPPLLDGDDEYVRLMINHHHTAAGHPGMERTMADLRAKYFILRLRTVLRGLVRSCRACRIIKCTPKPPLMGQLPPERLAQGERPFSRCGLDFFGPLLVRSGRRTEKKYGALFTCLTTRAIHIELAHSLSADAAIMTIRRMAARRGYPTVMFSDNGTNFHGADRELKAAVQELRHDSNLLTELTTRNVDWRFISPSSPHMGGAWERLIRSVKVALSATLKERIPNVETLLTALAEAEYTVNSRPLTHVSMDPKDDEPLTPNHFLMGSSGVLPPLAHYSKEHENVCLKKQWRVAQQLADQFWRRWLREYLPTLAQRPKWRSPTIPLKEGDLVLLVDPKLPRNTWPRGRITQARPAADGQVRMVRIQTATGNYLRPAVKVAAFNTGDGVSAV
jgi:hypothetical protein